MLITEQDVSTMPSLAVGVLCCFTLAGRLSFALLTIGFKTSKFNNETTTITLARYISYHTHSTLTRVCFASLEFSRENKTAA